MELGPGLGFDVLDFRSNGRKAHGTREVRKLTILEGCCCLTPRFNCRQSTQRRAEARLLLLLKAPNCDGFLKRRA